MSGPITQTWGGAWGLPPRFQGREKLFPERFQLDRSVRWSDYSAANVLKSGDFLAAFSRHSDSGEQREWRTDWVKSGKEEYEERRESSPPSLLPPLPDFFLLTLYYAFPKRLKGFNRPFLSYLKPLFQSEAKCEAIGMKLILARVDLVCYTAVISIVTQRFSPGEERCVTTLIHGCVAD